MATDKRHEQPRAEPADGSDRRNLREHDLMVFVLSRLTPAIWGLPLVLDEMRAHPRLLFYGLLYACWVAVGGLALADRSRLWPVRVARFVVWFLWFYLVIDSIA